VSEDELVAVTERKEPVPRWEVLAENKTRWEQLYKHPGWRLVRGACLGLV
jgi:hypothetical protein